MSDGFAACGRVFGFKIPIKVPAFESAAYHLLPLKGKGFYMGE